MAVVITLGLTEQIVFPEISIESVEFVQGMHAAAEQLQTRYPERVERSCGAGADGAEQYAGV